MIEKNDIVKAWNDGNLELGIVYTTNKSGLVEYKKIKTIIMGDYFNSVKRCVNSINNIVKNYGDISISKHREEFPEDWI